MAEILLPQPLRPRQLLSSWRRRLPFFCSFLCYVLFIYKFSLQSHRYNSDSGISTHSISATKNIYSSYEGDSTGVHHGGGGGFTVIGPLHDQTLQWNFSVQRPWMDNAFAFSNGNSNEHEATPPAQLILTDYGFNHPDQAIGLTFPRTMRERELIQGFINHPWFVPVDWTRLNAAVLKRIAKRFTQNSGNARNESATSYNWMVEGETEDDGIPYYFQHSHHTSNSSQTKTSLPHQNHINYYKLQHPHSGIRYYILLDQSTCPERHYPIYGGIERNQDAISNRSTDKDAKSCSMGCDNIDKILNSPFVRYFGEYAHLVIWECSSKFRSIKKFDSYREGAVIVDRPPQQQESEQRDNTLGDTNVQNLFREEQKKRRIDNILFATLSSFHRDINPFLDQGLAPPPIKRAKLTKEQREAITSASCGNASIDSVARYDHQNNNNEHNQNNIQKPYFFTFIGSLGSDRDRRHRDDKPVYQPPNFHARTHLKPLHDPSKGIIILEGQQFQNQFTDSDNPQRRNMTYIDLLTQSHYGGSPRGHAKYTYRFTEILSAGAIPVVIADDWVLPFRPELVDWRECAVFVPEKNTLNTVEVLEGISEEETCRRHKACWRIYERWLDGAEREVEGLIEGWERVFGGSSGDGSWMKGSEEFGGVKCGYDDKECNFT